LRRRVDRIAPFLGGVTDRPIHRADFNRLRLRAALRHYAPIISKCQAILEGLYLATEGGTHRQDAFLWEMSILFEKALGGILATTPGVALERRRARARVVDGADVTVYTSKVKPDYILRGSGRRVLLDAKYKRTGVVGVSPDPEDEIDVTVAGAGKIRIGRADIYQAISYAQHGRYSPAETALVFPVALEADQELPSPYRVEGFSTVVQFLFLDVGQHAAVNLDAFREILAAMFAPELKVA
jgi:5-methylcytosine-specific restriction endonuclease McrBC regulatory subunit McrC